MSRGALLLIALFFLSLHPPSFVSVRSSLEASSPCDVAQSEKIDCGWPSIPKDLCIGTANCCFESTSSPVCFYSNQATLPGFKTALTKKGVGYLTSVGLNYIQNYVSTIHIPTVAGEKDSIDWKVENLLLSDLSIESVAIGVSDSIPGIIIDAQGVTAKLTGHWKGEESLWPHEPKASGDAKVEFSDSSLKLNVGILVDQTGKLQTFSAGSHVHLNHLDMHFSGSHLDWIIHVLEDIFPHQVHDKVTESLEDSFDYLLDHDLDDIISTYPTSLNITDGFGVDYSLVSEVVLQPDFLTFPSFGTIYDVNTSKHKFDGGPIPLPNYDGSFFNKDVQLFLSESIPNSAGYVFYRENQLQITVNNAQVPSYSPIRLNTSDWKILVPNLYERYPNWLMECSISASSPPKTVFLKEGANVTANVSIHMDVISPINGSAIAAFDLAMWAIASGKATIVDGRVIPKLNYLTSGASLTRSFIGTFNSDVLTSLIVFLAEDVFVPWANTHLATGLPIPSVDNVSVKDSMLYYSKGLLIGATDVQYHHTTSPSPQLAA